MGFPVFAANPAFAIRESTKENEHEFRDKFSRDRDRILYSKAFRRLSGKTQVFVPSFDDHVRTRLTHTIEVSQIAKTVAKRLGLDETLTESIALGHDIGHTPFGHVGERTLNDIMNGCIKIRNFNSALPTNVRGFKHNWQGVRVVRELESKQRSYKGLNLTNYTAWGILNHSSLNFKDCKKAHQNESSIYCGLNHGDDKCHQKKSLDFYLNYVDDFLSGNSWTFEGMVVGIADEIAQRHHDIEDGIEANIVDRNRLLEYLEFVFSDYLKPHKKDFDELRTETEKLYYLPKFSKFIVNLLTTEFILNSQHKLEKLINQYQIYDQNSFENLKHDLDFKEIAFKSINFSDEFSSKEKLFQNYLKTNILNSYQAQRMDGRSQFIIKQLFKAYVTNPQQLPNTTIERVVEKFIPEAKNDTSDYRRIIEESHYANDENYRGALLRTITDYISGMTDSFAIYQYQSLYGIRSEY